MIVTCPRCMTKYNLPGEKLTSGAELNLHCSRCGWEFLFSSQNSDGDLGSADVPLPPAVEELEVEPPEATDPVALEDEGVADEVATIDAGSEAEAVEVSSPDLEEVAVEGVESAPGESIFELSDDFDGDDDFSLDEPPDSHEEALGPAEKSRDEGGDQEFVLDIDDLNLDDIEFDSFEDDSDSVVDLDDTQKESQKERPTQLDDDGDFDDLLKQVEDLPPEALSSKIEEARAKKSGKQTEMESSMKSSVSSPTAVKSPKVGDKKRNFMLVLICFVVLSLALWVAYGLWQRFSVDMVKHLKLVEVENRRLRLPSDRIVIVLRGKVVNSSPKLVTDLKIKGVLLDEAGRVVTEVVTAGGVSFSEEELDRLDGSKLAMLENNTITLAPDGGELPFMIAFYNYPDKVHECYVELSSFKVKKGPRP